MKTKPIGIIVGLVLAMVIVAILAANSPDGSKTFTGKDVFRLNCAGCHGIDRSGYSDIYPSLLNLGKRLSREEILKQINRGKGMMPSFAHLSQEEKEALIAYLLEDAEKIVESPVENLGERIFRSNCAGCHRATVNDTRPPNTRMMEPAPLAGATKRFTKDEFFRILETGICYMPSFSHFTADEKEALYAFVKSLEGEGEPSRPTMGEMCPMMMRMRRGHRPR